MLNFQEYKDMQSFDDAKYLEEKLIVFNGGKQHGQIIFMAGGAGSGKGFSIENFIDSRNAKILNVDELKRLLIKLSKNQTKWLSSISLTKKQERIDIADFSLLNPRDVVSLHDYVVSLGLKNKVMENLLKGIGKNRNEKDLPNILFDITGKNTKQFAKIIQALEGTGYKPRAFHVIWVLQKFSIAVKQNKKRARQVAKVQMFLTHDGAGKTMFDAMKSEFKDFKSIGVDGQFTVIFNDPKFTVFAKGPDGKPLIETPNPNAIKRVFNSETGEWEKAPRTVVTDFKRVILKREGKPFTPEKGAMEQVADEMIKAVPSMRVAMFAGGKGQAGPLGREAIAAKGRTKAVIRKSIKGLKK